MWNCCPLSCTYGLMGSNSICIILHMHVGETLPDTITIRKSFVVIIYILNSSVCPIMFDFFFVSCVLAQADTPSNAGVQKQSLSHLIRFSNAIFITAQTEGIKIKCEKSKPCLGVAIWIRLALDLARLPASDDGAGSSFERFCLVGRQRCCY